MKKILLVAFILISGNAFAATDYQCVSDCTDKGYLHAYCKEKCSYGEDSSGGYEKKSKQVDYTCVSDCTSQGYLHSYCESKCSY